MALANKHETAGGALIRPMHSHDLAMVLQWRNHPDVRMYMYQKQVIESAEHQAWFDRCMKDENVQLLIFEYRGIPAGFIKLNVTCAHRIAEWGFYVKPGSPRGTGAKLGYTTLRYAFGERGLHKIFGRVLDYNVHSIAFHKKLGFKQEGILRDEYFDGVQYHTVVSFGLLANEWHSLNSEVVR